MNSVDKPIANTLKAGNLKALFDKACSQTENKKEDT